MSAHDRVNGGRTNDRIANLSNDTMKISFIKDFFIFKASIAFTQLKKTFTKALILYNFDILS